MSKKSVPFVIYENGVRKVIGTAEVDLETGETEVEVENVAYREMLSPRLVISSHPPEKPIFRATRDQCPYKKGSQ